jgi:hypothetical protein
LAALFFDLGGVGGVFLAGLVELGQLGADLSGLLVALLRQGALLLKVRARLLEFVERGLTRRVGALEVALGLLELALQALKVALGLRRALGLAVGLLAGHVALLGQRVGALLGGVALALDVVHAALQGADRAFEVLDAALALEQVLAQALGQRALLLQGALQGVAVLRRASVPQRPLQLPDLALGLGEALLLGLEGLTGALKVGLLLAGLLLPLGRVVLGRGGLRAWTLDEDHKVVALGAHVIDGGVLEAHDDARDLLQLVGEIHDRDLLDDPVLDRHRGARHALAELAVVDVHQQAQGAVQLEGRVGGLARPRDADLDAIGLLLDLEALDEVQVALRGDRLALRRTTKHRRWQHHPRQGQGGQQSQHHARREARLASANATSPTRPMQEWGHSFHLCLLSTATLGPSE